MPTPTSACALPDRFFWPLRVYWEDTDAGGVVFYANYLKFFERARTEWLRAAGIGQQALREATGTLFVVSATELRYLAPARLDDRLQVSVVLQQAGRASLVLDQQAWRIAPGADTDARPDRGPDIAAAAADADSDAAATGTAPHTSPFAGAQLLCEGRIRIGCVDAASLRPRRLPEVLQALLAWPDAPAAPLSTCTPTTPTP